MKKSAVKCAALIALTLAIIFAFMPSAFAAETPEAPNAEGLSPIPLLVIKISFDANGNGKNDFDQSDSKRLFNDKTSPYYGEQWCDSSDKYWADILFADSNTSLKKYYQEVSGGSFYFYPAEENYVGKDGAVNDGIVEVVVPHKHPMAKTGSDHEEDASSREAALREAGKYVDFSKFDKNKDGKLSYDELAIVFVCGGYECSTSSASPIHKLAFGVWGHYTGGAPVTLNGVKVGSSFVRIGEYAKATTLQTIGIFAHELGHFIGAPDLYDTNDQGTKWNYASNVSLMSSGSHNKFSGRPSGTGPSYMDPACAVSVGIQTATTITKSGDYTLYSRHSKKGEYNILRINTPNPKEYYLIENRYHEDGETQFDVISATSMGIMIWHIDENAAPVSIFSSPNSHGYGHDPAVVPMGIGEIGTTNCGFRYTDNSMDGSEYTFESGSSKYRFPISRTSYTSLTKAQSADFFFTVTVKKGSYAANEMTVTVNFEPKLSPDFIISFDEKATRSISVKAHITDYFKDSVSEIKVIMSKNDKPDESNGIVKTMLPDGDDNFDFTIDGLEPNTKYFLKVIVTGKNGTRQRTYHVYTSVEKKPRTDYYYVYFFKGITAVDRRYGVKVKPGELLKYSFPMEDQKKGFDFCGWYLDPELTTRYDMGFTQTVCEDFPLYAKWVETGKAARLKLVGAESKYLLFACEVGDKLVIPVPKEREGLTFIGWYEDAELTSPFDFTKEVDSAEEITLYAKWEDANGNVVTTASDKPVETTSVQPVETSSTGTTPVPSKNVTVPTYVIVIVLVVVAVIAGVLPAVIRKKKTE